jgi:hypothetical protein
MGNTLSNFDWASIVMLLTAKKRMIREKSFLFMAAFIHQFTIYRNTKLHRFFFKSAAKQSFGELNVYG